jgi:peptidoglycan hydrolase-like protein with peptidoglycan-binding domain
MNTKSIVAGIIITAALAAPFAASALSIDELQQQIKDLLSKVASLQTQVRLQSTSSSSVTMPQASANARICTLINRNLSRGYSGDDVRGLQEFLTTQGFLNASATGYFGPATASALAKWQSQNGVSAIGSFGPLSRERIKKWCNNSGNALLQVSPQKGSAPLTVTVTSKTGDASDYRPSIADGRDTMIDFGDGSERQWVHCSASPQDIYPTRCETPVSFSHTYSSNGTYVVSLMKTGGFCAGGCKDEVLASEKVVVGDTPIACTLEYNPVCGAKPVVCITTPCNPVPTTYGNLCSMKADNAALLYQGECIDSGTTNGTLNADPSSGAAPLPVAFTYQPGEDNGQYWISFGDGDGQIMNLRPIYCIRAPCISPVGANHTYTNAGTYTVHVEKYIACLHTNPQCKIATIPLAKTTVTVTGSSSGGAPVISQFSGPTLLGVNEIGTWKITATDPENGSLSYSILWGDEWTAYDAANRSVAPTAGIQQNTTFTHSYANAGNYTVALTVTDSTGKSARTTGSVQVTPTVCTAEYAPVCARPNGCANTCPAGSYCTLQCQLYSPQTYSNRCQANNSNATFMHDGVCTGNEGYLQ